jgi:hypothetical protein
VTEQVLKVRDQVPTEACALGIEALVDAVALQQVPAGIVFALIVGKK